MVLKRIKVREKKVLRNVENGKVLIVRSGADDIERTNPKTGKWYSTERKEKLERLREVMERELSEGEQDLWIHRERKWGLKRR